MAEATGEFADILDRYQRLGKPDRKAILRSFSPEERIAFEKAVEAEDEARRAEEISQRQADRQFLCYSPQVAKIAEAAVKGGDCKLAPRTLEALLVVHEQLKASENAKARPGLQGLLDRVAAFFAPPSSAPSKGKAQ